MTAAYLQLHFYKTGNIVQANEDENILQGQKHFTKRITSLANLSYPERLAALDLELL